MFVCMSCTSQTFQSTRLREARPAIHYWILSLSPFQSTRLREARHEIIKFRQEIEPVSIHAPA